MRPIRITLFAAMLAATITACGPNGDPVSSAEPMADLIIRNVNVVPMDRARVLENRTVVIRAGRISSIQSAESALPGASEIVDGSGQYLMPGLADMHVHLFGEDMLPLFLANGVTVVRNMWGFPGTLAMREEIQAGNMLGPRIFTAGPIIDGADPVWANSTVITDPDQAKAVVDAQVDAGYDFIKVYETLDPETYQALSTAAKSRGVPIAGHIPRAVSLQQAIDSGQRSVEHLVKLSQLSIAEGSMLEGAYGHRSDDASAFFAAAERLAAGELSLDELYNPQRLARWAQAMAEARLWSCPTVVVLGRIALDPASAQRLMDEPYMRYVAPTTRSSWPQANNIRSKNGGFDWSMAAQNLRKRVHLMQVSALHEAGAPLLLGTDTPNPFVAPGYSIHDELANFIAAGLSPFEALAAGTRDAARYLQASHEFGTVAEGLAADLILLDSNPLEDVDAVRDPVGIVLAGRWLSAADLQASLNALVDKFEGRTDWFSALPPLGDTAQRYAMTYNDSELGAVRFALTPDGFVEQSVVDFSGRAVSELSANIDGQGRVQRARLQQETSAGVVTAELVREAGQATLRSPAANGEPTAQTLPMDDQQLLVPGLLAANQLILAKRLDVPIGTEFAISRVTLDLGSGRGLAPDRMTLVRKSSAGDSHRFEIAIESANPATGEIVFKNTQIETVEVRFQSGVLRYTRTR